MFQESARGFPRLSRITHKAKLLRSLSQSLLNRFAPSSRKNQLHFHSELRLALVRFGFAAFSEGKIVAKSGQFAVASRGLRLCVVVEYIKI